MPAGVPRISLVDTFKDEAEESLRVAEALGKRLDGVRLDTPGERGRVTTDLVKEVRARLDLAGFKKASIFASWLASKRQASLLAVALTRSALPISSRAGLRLMALALAAMSAGLNQSTLPPTSTK